MRAVAITSPFTENRELRRTDAVFAWNVLQRRTETELYSPAFGDQQLKPRKKVSMWELTVTGLGLSWYTYQLTAIS